MPDPLWPISTPEANHTRLVMGTGPATTLANKTHQPSLITVTVVGGRGDVGSDMGTD